MPVSTSVCLTFGVMFTPDQDKAAAEMLRVCRSGGKIGLANWTPDGFIGQLFKTLGKYLPPPAGAKSPALWGTRARIAEMFGPSALAIKAEPRHFVFRYRSPEHFLEIFKNYYGPMLKAFAALDAANQQGLRDDLLALIGRMNRAEDGTMVVPSEYLEIVITRALIAFLLADGRRAINRAAAAVTSQRILSHRLKVIRTMIEDPADASITPKPEQARRSCWCRGHAAPAPHGGP